MRRPTLLRAITPIALATIFACDDSSRPTDTAMADDRAVSARENGSASTPFAAAQVFFEYNTTDDDLGLQIFLDAEGWDNVRVLDPRLRELVQISARGPLSTLGITELRFESAEPEPAEVLARFRPGTYEFRGRTVEGDQLLSMPMLSHDFTPRPTIRPSNGETVDPSRLVVTWNAPGAERVEIIIEHPETGHSFDVIVPGTVSRLDVPPQFLTRGTTYKIEILSYSPNGNRTIVESTFVTS
jgi:hypothetical protein